MASQSTPRKKKVVTRRRGKVEDYFLIIGDEESDDEEEIRKALTELNFPGRKEQRLYWPEELGLSNISKEQIASARIDILKALSESSCSLYSILKPSKRKLNSWLKPSTLDIDNLLTKAKDKTNKFVHLKRGEVLSILLLRIDDENDSNKKIRNLIKKLLSENALNKRALSFENYFQTIGDESDELKLADADEGELPDLLKQEEVTEMLPQPEYYPPQVYLAEKIVERIEVILKAYHKKTLSSFKDFDFVIYTANTNMLEDQTCARLSRKDSGCFPEQMYKYSDAKARRMAWERVYKYHPKSIHPYQDFCDRVTKEKETLFVVVADEGHWGATEKGKPHYQLINTWNTEEHPNVIVLLVTATPYNLLTENSRIPMAYYKPSSCDVKVQEGHSKIPKDYKHLHRVRWTECFDAEVKKGMIVKLRIPLPNRIFQLYIDSPRNDTDFLPWKGVIPGSFAPYAEEFLLQEDERGVRITTVDQTHAFVVKDDRCGFVHCSNIEGNYISNFQILHNYGEGIILLGFPVINKKDRCLYLESKTNQIAHRETRRRNEDDYAVPNLDETFLIEQWKPPGSLIPIEEYISLNYYFNSMRNMKRNDQLIREDKNGIWTKVQKTNSVDFGSDDILAAEYSYYIIIINKIREYLIDSSFIHNNFTNLYQCIQEYHSQCRSCVDMFKEELKRKRKNMQPIKESAFNEFLKVLLDDVMKNFEKHLRDFQINPLKSKARNLFSAIVSCLLHSASVDQHEIEEHMENIEKKLNGWVTKELSECIQSLYAFNLEDNVENILLRSETACIVSRLIPKSLGKLDGCMTIFRMETCNSGDKVYNTLCIARKVSSKVDYLFEILRDYGKFKLSDDFDDKPKTNSGIDIGIRHSRYRIRERLQTKKCTNVDPETLQSCQCSYKDHETLKLFGPSMECQLCCHVHKRIVSYSDLEKLPCILILVHKGRLGDTFPLSLKVVDSRLCHTKKTGHLSLATIVQEMGRMCRYQAKSCSDSLPYALIGKHLFDTLKNSLLKGAPFHSLVKLDSVAQLDAKTMRKKNKSNDPRNEQIVDNLQYSIVAGPLHSDYKNMYKHNNRILLEAEPQIGKTGVYLKVISTLNRYLSDEFKQEQEDLENIYHMPDGSEQEQEDGEDDTGDDKDVEIYWQYPHWTHMEKSKFRKTVNESKYDQHYGKYEHGNPPPVYMPVSSTKMKNDRKLGAKQKIQRTEIQSYNFREHSCVECFTRYENKVFEFTLPCNTDSSGVDGKVKFKLSIPMVEQFAALRNRIEEINIANSDLHNNQNHNETAKALHTTCFQKLNSCIFIPTYNRSDRANVNLYHTMMTNNNGSHHRCFYTSVLVVRQTDFKQYYKLWQSAHAILQIPDTLPNAERDVDNGGIGFARLSIQIFAEALDLKWIFMLDDNIRYVYEVERNSFSEDTDCIFLEKVKRNDDTGTLIEEKVFLFDVLKHIEKQVDGSIEVPPADLPRYTDTHIDVETERLEEYTGPSKIYGVIGIKSYSPTCRKAKKPFIKTHVFALVFLNISSLKEKKIRYKPWPVSEDLNLNDDCNNEGLWVCKYNRFTFWKQYMRTWLPLMHVWDENSNLADISLDSSFAQNSDDILIKYLKSDFVMKSIHTSNFEDQRDFNTILRNIKVQDGKHVLIATQKIHNLQLTLKQQISSSTNSDSCFILLTSSDLCKKNNLTSKLLIGKWINKLVPNRYRFTYEVLTSHNVNLYAVKNVLITVKVTVPGHSLDRTLDSQPSTSKRQRCDEEHEELFRVQTNKRTAHKLRGQTSAEHHVYGTDTLRARVEKMDTRYLRGMPAKLIETLSIPNEILSNPIGNLRNMDHTFPESLRKTLLTLIEKNPALVQGLLNLGIEDDYVELD